MKIIVDADACPVKQEIVRCAAGFAVPVWLVASYDHHLRPQEGVTIVQVDRSDQSVDMYIANRLSPGDVLITQDFGLAALGLAKGAIVLSYRGQQYTDRTIDFLLDRRAEQARLRRGGRHSGGPKAFSAADRMKFQQMLTKVLTALQE
jgi:hypothetical protein